MKRQFLLLFAISLLLFVVAPRGDSNAAPLADQFLYLPYLTKPSSDLMIARMEVTQAVQKEDNSVPLVANRPTLVRIFAQSSDKDMVNVTVSLTAQRGGSTLGVISLGPGTVTKTPSRGSYNSTFNSILPSAWLSGDVQITAVIDPANIVAETNEGNNSLVQSVRFNEVPDLQVVVVPINYTHQGSNSPGYYPGNRVDYISNYLMRTYPVDNVNVTIRGSNYPFTGNLQLGSAWSQLLNEMYQLKTSDGLPSSTPKVYYGFVPINNGSSQWFYSGIAGIGYIGFRESVGLNLGNNDDTGELAAHEIGHNFGRSHAPCGVSNTDPNYPYAGASIGEYGVDGIMADTPILLDPAGFVDIMSYCNPVWFSDYTYTALYNDQISNGKEINTFTTAAGRGLMIVGSIADDGAVSLAPLYALPLAQPDAPADSAYSIELLNAAGDVVASQPIAVAEAEEDGVHARAVRGVMPLPATAVSHLRLLHEGRIVATRTLDNSLVNMAVETAVVQTPDEVTVSWGVADVPAIVRYQVDGVDGYTTVGINVLGGSLTVDTTTLPAGENGRFEIIFADTGTPTFLTATLPDR